MNKFEKEAIKMLGEEEQNEILGGSKETDVPLTDEQCSALKEKLKETMPLGFPFPTMLQYGAPVLNITEKS